MKSSEERDYGDWKWVRVTAEHDVPDQVHGAPPHF